MSSRNRFSYNQAVNNIAALSDNNNSIQPIQKVKKKGKVLSKNDISLPLPLYHQGSERATNSNKLHHRTPSNASSLPKYSISEFEEENLSTVDEQLNWLIPGEELMHRELNVGFHKQDKPERVVLGRVYVTNYRLRFEERVTVASTHKEHIQFDITLGSISKIEKIGYYKVRPNAGNIGPPYGINIVCKDIRNVRFINRRESHGRRALVESLRKHAFPNTNRLPFFANMYREKFQHDGWILFDVIREFQRQKVPKHAWALSRINQNYEFAGTYPALFFVPAEVFRQKSPDDFLHSVSEFRSKKRIPVLSWIDSRTSAALVRSSQPMIGALTRKSASDEDYIEMIIGANPNSRSLIILDARPRINARANRANGGGYESENYPMCKLEFMDIQNIHIVRDSLKKLKEACFPQIRPKHFQKTLEETKWLSHLLTILEAASEAARQILVNRSSVLIHCSDGWDRTAQITSLAMLQLDSFYRTIEGFAVLVEKEWCSFGHKFAHRIGHGQEKPDDKERSPIFIQFIDCVWQLYNQFTPAFQFNVRFLKTILDELYSCRFGTFLYNCERERAELQVKQNTASLWSFVLDNRMLFINDKYDPNATLDDFTMNAKVHPLFWTDYYCRYSLLQDATDNISVTSSITPNTPLSIAPVLEISQQHSEHSPQTPTNSREPQQQHSQSSPLASPQATPENPTRQRRWTPSTTMPQTYVNTNLLVSELRQHQNTYQFPNTSTAAAAALASPTRSSSSAGSDRHIITRV